MRYDPILCMNVSDSMKAKDAESARLDELYNAAKAFERGLKELKARGSAAGYVEAMQKKYDEAKKKYRAAGGTKSLDEKALDKAISACDALSDLRGATPVGNGYVKDTGSEFVVYDSYGNKKGKYATFDEAANHARNL